MCDGSVNRFMKACILCVNCASTGSTQHFVEQRGSHDRQRCVHIAHCEERSTTCLSLWCLHESQLRQSSRFAFSRVVDIDSKPRTSSDGCRGLIQLLFYPRKTAALVQLSLPLRQSSRRRGGTLSGAPSATGVVVVVFVDVGETPLVQAHLAPLKELMPRWFVPSSRTSNAQTTRYTPES